jgi:hypothetical protein
MSGLFDLSGLFSDFFGHGSVPPESVARKILGIGTALPLDRDGVMIAFRWRIKALRPDLDDAGADRLRLKDITEEELPVLDVGSTVRFDSGSTQEQLAELLWAREDLIGRLPRPVTGTAGWSHAVTPPPAPVTQWGERQQERADQHRRRLDERDREWEERRDERETRKAEQKRYWARQGRREAKRRRRDRAPRELRCFECRQVIDRDEVAIVGCSSRGRDEFTLNPYAVSRSRWNEGGYYHAACLLDAPLQPVAWLDEYLADGVPLETECAVCGRRIKPPRWVKRRDGGKVFYCSEGCAGGADAIARRVEPVERSCVVCGERFTPARSDARYCSSACRQDAYRKRKLGATAS